MVGMTDFLLELRSEEIPARMQKNARAELEKLFRREMDAANIAHGAVTVWSTPRRLALIARDMPQQTLAVREEAKGPPEGAPDQAIEGFCRKNGVTRGDLEVRDIKGRPTLFAIIEKPGQAVADLLARAIPAIIDDFSWPKSMRWGGASISTESLRWVRPLSGIVALFDGKIVDCAAHGITSGAVTLGHRFHHSGDITIGGPDDYAVKLRAAHVIVDHAEREKLIRDGARRAAQDAGLELVEDEGLVVENAGLTEWPVPLLGRFDDDFLQVPPETIQLTARVNQKYFVCEKAGAGKQELTNAFICTANVEAADGGHAIVDGNRKVLAARLADARFFWDVDRKKTLAQHAEGLQRITFHEKLGTVADKTERVAKLAEWLATEGIVPGCDPVLARQAAELCKADLVTEMVGEFPELQGVMGGYYARAEGLDEAIADAIRDHYKPVGQGDVVPTAPATVAVSLADKLDTLVGFFSIGEMPTGSRDPFALRRSSLGIIAVVLKNELRFSFGDAVAQAGITLGINSDFGYSKDDGSGFGNVNWFLADRLKVQQREAGVRHDFIDAVFALGGEDDLVRLLARVRALRAFIETEDGANLLAGYKRAANILTKEGWGTENNHRPVRDPESRSDNEDPIPHTGEEDPLAQVDDPILKDIVAQQVADKSTLSYTFEPAEKALIDALDVAEPQANAAIVQEEFAAAMSALASLRAPIDAFFEGVTVNDQDQDKRAARLELLARFRDAVHAVADFSQIEG